MMRDFIRGQDFVVTSQRTGIDYKKFDLQLAGKHVSCSQREIVFLFSNFPYIIKHYV